MAPSRSALLATIALVLSACGGASGDGGAAASPSTPAAAIALSCDGTVRELFTAIEGTYTGTVDPGDAPGRALPLTAGKAYPVTVSAAHCSIEIVADGMVRLAYAYAHPANVTPSRLTAITPTDVIHAPTALDLTRNQYSVRIETDGLSLELERLIATSSGDGGWATGDLRLTLSAPSQPGASYALDMPLASRR